MEKKKLNYFCVPDSIAGSGIDWNNIINKPSFLQGDAPDDGNIYGRENGQWTNIEKLRALSQFPPEIVSFDSNVKSRTVEVGTFLQENVNNLIFSYTANNAVNFNSVSLYLNGENKTPQGFLINSPFFFPLTEEYNKKMSPHEDIWEIRSLNLLDEEIINEPIVHKWALRTFIGFSTRDDIEDYNSVNFEIDGAQSVLDRPESASKPLTNPAKYLYIFLPVGIDGDNSGYTTYSKFYLNQFETPMEKSTATIERFSVPVTYDIFRTANPTFGAI